VRQLLAGELNLTAMEPGDKPWVVGLGLLLVAGGAVLTVWVASALASRRPKAKWDLWAAAAVEVGVLACTITLVTGGIWARGAWGEWRDWAFSDPRLVTVYIMWFTYVGYLVFRSTLEDLQRRERFSAVFAVIGMVNLPIVYLSIRVFAQVSHPMHLETTETSMTVTRWFGALAFLVLYVALWRSRHQVHVLRQATDRLQHEFGQAGV
jgi:heme exporter protein C